MDGTIIRLSKPIEAFNQTFNEIGLKEPTGALFMRLGEPRTAVATGGEANGWYMIENESVVRSYFDKLVVIEGDDGAVKATVMAQLSLEDVTALKRVLFSYFEAAVAKSAAAIAAARQ